LNITALLGAAVGLSFASLASAQTPPPVDSPSPPPPTLVIDRTEVHSAKSLTVTSTDFADGAVIPMDDTSYGASKSPPLAIARAPRGTKSYAILMEDPDSQYKGEAILHWFAYNLPGDVTNVPPALPEGAKLTAPITLNQSPGIRGKAAYFGPHPPAKPPFVHHYHVEVFALDAVLPDGVTDRTALIAAMSGHVLAEGQLVGTASASAATSPKPAA
jgi:Raf kinase inhibitor-like YbhB/YbcL family protein